MTKKKPYNHYHKLENNNIQMIKSSKHQHQNSLWNSINSKTILIGISLLVAAIWFIYVQFYFPTSPPQTISQSQPHNNNNNNIKSNENSIKSKKSNNKIERDSKNNNRGVSLNSVPPSESLTILAEYPHDSYAFTQGLEIYNHTLYETTGLYGQSTLRIVDLPSGKVLKKVALSHEYFGEGLTVFNDKIYVLTWLNRVGLVFDKDLNYLGDFSYDTEGWGLTHDDKNLILSDGSSNLYFYSPYPEFKLLSILPVKQYSTKTKQLEAVSRLNELEYIDNYIYANIWLTDKIAAIDPKTGLVVKYFTAEKLVKKVFEKQYNRDAICNGIAFDTANNQLYITGKLWNKLFHVKYDQIMQSEDQKSNSNTQ